MAAEIRHGCLRSHERRVGRARHERLTRMPYRFDGMELAGRTVMPGLLMLHEHLVYPIGPELFGLFGESFIRLYLVGGLTTMRTAGSLRALRDLELSG